MSELIKMLEKDREELEKKFTPKTTIDQGDDDFQMSDVVKAEKKERKKTPENLPEKVSSKFRELDSLGDDDRFDEMLDADFKTIRENIIQMTGYSSDMLDDLKALSGELDSPRGFEVLADSLIKMKDLNVSVIDLYRQREEIRAKRKNNDDGEESSKTQNNTQNNTYVFNGSTAELLGKVKKNKNEDV